MLKRVILTGGAVAAILLASASTGPAAAQQILEQVLVRVNGENITKTQFEARQVDELRSRPELAGTSATSAELQRVVAELTPEIILDMVDELLLVQRAREQGLAMSDQQFNQIVASIKSANNLEDDERFEAALRQEGMTLAQLRQMIERNMLTEQVVRTEIFQRVSVTEAEARQYYDANRRAFTKPADITLREIFLEVPATDRGVNVAQDDEVRAKAEDLRRRAQAGESFAALAGEHSMARSRDNDGLIGPMSRDDLDPQLQTVLDGMRPGEITVRRISGGYQILMLEQRTESAALPFQDARPEISRLLGEQKFEYERLRYLDRLRGEANIVWRNDELRRAYEQALSARRSEHGAPPALASGR